MAKRFVKVTMIAETALQMAIEVKSSEHVAETRPKGLHLFDEKFKPRRGLIISRDPFPEKIGPQITILPWQQFCRELWNGDII